MKKDNERNEQENALENEELLNKNKGSLEDMQAAGTTGNETPGTADGEVPVNGGEAAAGSEEAPIGSDETAGSDEADAVSAEEKLREEIQALNDKNLRLLAEFDNFKRRSVKERVELIGSASKGAILALLPILDDFDRAQKSMESATDVQAVREGIELIIAKFRSILAQQGVKEMDSIGTPFNADLHEAVSNVPAPSEDMKGKVIDQLEKGYYLNDKVIRFAKVFVGA